MRNLAKYFLALTVIGIGFYAAQQHRHPIANRSGVTASVRKPPPASAPSRDSRTSTARASESLPVAALADVDRVPLLGGDHTSAPIEPNSADRATVTNLPTVRGNSPPSQSPSAEASTAPVRETAPEETKKTVATNTPKKQETKKKPAAKPPEKEFQPPNFSREYPTNSDHVEPNKQAASRGEDTSDQSGDTGNTKHTAAAASQSGDHTRPVPPGAAPSRHRIAEGDTLRRIAEKYLGSRDSYLDIYQANQDVLFDPQLIPIGVEIMIPAKTVIVAQAATDSTKAEDTGSRPSP